MMELTTLFGLNDREMKLVCLYHNGKDAVVDFIAYLVSTADISIDGKTWLLEMKNQMLKTSPRYFKKYPSECKRMCDEFDDIQNKLFIGRGDLEIPFDGVNSILLLGGFISEASEKKFVDGTGETINWYDRDERSWRSYWNVEASYIVEILTYLKENGYFDERIFFQKCIEVETVIYCELNNGLYKKYFVELNEYYGNSDYQDIVQKYSRKYEVKMHFDIQLEVDVVNAKPREQKLYFLGSDKFSFSEVHLHSDMCKKMFQCSKNVFRDKLGEMNEDRYRLRLFRIQQDYTRVYGFKAGDVRLSFQILLLPHDDSIPNTFFDNDSNHSKAFLTLFNECLNNYTKEELGFEVGHTVTSWDYDTNEGLKVLFHVNIYKDKSSQNVKWTIEEAIKVNDIIFKVQEDIDEDNSEFVYIRLHKPFYIVHTNSVNFSCVAISYSPGLTKVIEDLIPYCQESVLDIPPY